MVLELDKLGGPHFRAEEEAMYPILRKFFGEHYYNRLLEEHDRVIKAGREIALTLGKGIITDEEAERLYDAVLRLLATGHWSSANLHRVSIVRD